MSPGLAAQRVSYRDGRRRDLVRPGEVVEVTLGNLLTPNLFTRGHRVRIVISGSFMPHLSRNLQTGRLETESAETGRRR